MDKERFSLLLLEPSEIYFEDFYTTLKNSNNEADECLGHLKMCSKSLVFVPKDKVSPLIKLPYKDCEKLAEWDGSLQSTETNVISITMSQYIEMLNDNILAPYKFIEKKRTFLFYFHYAKVSDYLQQICQLHRASSLHAYEQNSMIATIVYSRHNRIKFNPLWLDDIYENVIDDKYVVEINPLVVNPGRMLLSRCSMYFQSYSNIHAYPVKKIRLKGIYSIMKRRFLLRHIGLEIKWAQDDNDHLLYISFNNQNERDAFYEKTLSQEETNLQENEPQSMTLKWQNGIISNYDYLLYLNSLADRSFQDLTQYPVFPWVISNYKSATLNLSDHANYRDLSKPVGALNPVRLEQLKERCDEMDDPKFLYGSHYSAPGFVLFYLVRKYPNLMLCLQNGRFDHPDRMFNRVDDAFNNCLNNMSDFKELIPEFYDPANGGDFLVNSKKINFGVKFDGTAVNNVILPPWAERSPKRFIEILREALESDYVSKNLNLWIDLIFGYKQRGEEAIKANNLFYHLCYEGAVDLDNVPDLAGRHALEVQISEFGQIPKQLFDRPHAPKIMTIPPMVHRRSIKYQISVNELSHNLMSSSMSENMHEDQQYNDDDVTSITNLILDSEFATHKHLVMCTITDQQSLYSAGKDGYLKCYDMQEKRQSRSALISDMPVSACIKIPDSGFIVMSIFDDTIVVYNMDFGRQTNVVNAHDDSVSCLSYIESIGILVSGSWDCSVKIWKGFTKDTCNSVRSRDAMIAYLPLEEKITCVQAFSLVNVIKIVIGTATGEIWLWTIEVPDFACPHVNETIVEPRVMEQHDDEVSAICVNSSQTKIASCGKDKLILVIDIDTCMVLFKKYLPHPLTCMNWSRSDELLVLGDACGIIYIWDVVTGTIDYQQKVHSDFVTTIATTKDNKQIVTSGKDNCDYFIRIWNV